MRIEHRNGPEAVAQFLRDLADGITTGHCQFGAVQVACPEGVEARIRIDDEPTTLLVTVDFDGASRRGGTLGVERELAHPGG